MKISREQLTGAGTALFMTVSNGLFNVNHLVDNLQNMNFPIPPDVTNIAAILGMSTIAAVRVMDKWREPGTLINDVIMSTIPSLAAAISGLGILDHLTTDNDMLNLFWQHTASISIGYMGMGAILDRMKPHQIWQKFGVGALFGIGAIALNSIIWQNMPQFQGIDTLGREVFPGISFFVLAGWHAFSKQFDDQPKVDYTYYSNRYYDQPPQDPGFKSQAEWEDEKYGHTKSRRSNTDERTHQENSRPRSGNHKTKKEALNDLAAALGETKTDAADLKKAYRKFVLANADVFNAKEKDKNKIRQVKDVNDAYNVADSLGLF